MPRNDSEIVFALGAEGGLATIKRNSDSPRSLRYSVLINSRTAHDALNDDDKSGNYAPYKDNGFTSFEGAFNDIVNITGPIWVRLDPVSVHADYVDWILWRVEAEGGMHERTRWQSEFARLSKSEFARLSKPVGNVLTGTECIIKSHFFGDPFSKHSIRHKSATIKLNTPPHAFNAVELLKNLISQIQLNVETGCRKSNSRQNWRGDMPQPNIDHEKNKSKEVLLEKAIAELVKRDKLALPGWWNQMPIASGLIHANSDRRRAIDLVRKSEGPVIEFDFIELKIDSDTPLFALMEILLYGLVYLVLRRNPDGLSPESKASKVFKAQKVNLRVLAPKDYYKGYNLKWLHDELNNSLKTIANDNSSQPFEMSISSHWSSELEKWDEGILLNENKLKSLLDICSWNTQ